MNWASVFILFVFALYTLISWRILGPLDSISYTYYGFKEKNYSAAFNWFGISACAGCICQYFYVDGITFMLFIFSGLFMWLLTVASEYKNYSPHHFAPTVLAILFGFGALFSHYGWSPWFYSPLFTFLVGAGLLKGCNVPQSTTWAELLAVAAIIIPFLWVTGNT